MKFRFLSICVVACLVLSCSTSREPKTMRLFMQSKRPNIVLPYAENGNVGTASEKISFTQTSDTVRVEPDSIPEADEDVWKTVQLDRVDVVAARTVIKQVVMRDEAIWLEFDVKVPAVLIDNSWRVTLTPQLNAGDTIEFPLPPVVLAGEEFTRMQEENYKDYDLFLKGIIPPSAYDSAYLDRKGIARDITDRQELFYDIYEKERDRQIAYEKWKKMTIDRQNYFNMKKNAKRTKLYHRMERKRINERVKRYVTGADTTGLAAEYNRKYNKQKNLFPMYRMERTLTAKNVPSKYRDLYVSGRTMSGIGNFAFTAADSVEISRHRYFFDKIALNEMNDRNRDLMNTRMIPLPYIDSVKVRETSVPGKDYTYSYWHKLPVTEGMKKLRVWLDCIVEATDLSTWTPAPSDTLMFVVASLSDLVDNAPLQQFALESSLGDSVPTYTSQGESYKEGLRLLQERQYREALPLLEKHPDYNTALCLTQLGYHDAAVDLLVQLPSSARKEYLHAVICARLKEKEEAVEHMLTACRMDPDLVLRIPLDPELSELIPQFIGLRLELDNIASGQQKQNI